MTRSTLCARGTLSGTQLSAAPRGAFGSGGDYQVSPLWSFLTVRVLGGDDLRLCKILFLSFLSFAGCRIC